MVSVKSLLISLILIISMSSNKSQTVKQEARNTVKEELREELKDVQTLYVVGTNISTNANWDRGIWNRFQLYYIKNGKLHRIFITADQAKLTKPAHWSAAKRAFVNSVLGMDRVFDTVSSFGEWLYYDEQQNKSLIENAGTRFSYEFLSWRD